LSATASVSAAEAVPGGHGSNVIDVDDGDGDGLGDGEADGDIIPGV
jgi:hypothetical protein